MTAADQPAGQGNGGIHCRYCGVDLLTINYSCCELRIGDVDAITGKVRER